MAKPPRKKRQAKSTPAAVTPPAAPSGDLSPRAMEFAQVYDHAAQLINAIVLHRHEIVECVEELKLVRPSILQELAEASEETGELLVEVGALRVVDGN